MEQFIRYLYEYRDGKPVRNVGFVKVKRGETRTVVCIHGSGLRLEGETELRLYLFYTDPESPVGIPQGTVSHIDPAINYRLVYTPEDTGTPERYARIGGLILESERKRQFASSWDDMSFDIGNLRLRTETPETQTSMTEALVQAVRETEEIRKEQAAPETEAGRKEQIAPETEAGRKEQEAQETEAGREEQAAPETGPDAEVRPSGFPCRKISRQEIARLPRCEWKLANNSFLLHGYYNYHYLILLEEDGVLWLGVPGIYHRREARAAEAFGFPRFVRGDETDPEPAAEASGTGEAFGFWCRRVRRLNRP